MNSACASTVAIGLAVWGLYAAPAALSQTTSGAMAAEPSILNSIQDWMRRASGDYQNAVVKRLAQPAINPRTAESPEVTKLEAEKKATTAATSLLDAKSLVADVESKNTAEGNRISDKTLNKQGGLKAAQKKINADAEKTPDDDANRQALEAKGLGDQAIPNKAEAEAATLVEAKRFEAAKAAAVQLAAQDSAVGSERQRSAAAPLTPSKPARSLLRAEAPSDRRSVPIDRQSRGTLGRGAGTRAGVGLGNSARVSSRIRCGGAGRKIKPPGFYLVAVGDTLWDIAGLHYDNGRRYPVLMRANAARLGDAGMIWPCKRLRIPKLLR